MSVKLDRHKSVLEGQSKPTIEQIAWVFACLRDCVQQPGSYRNMIYGSMELPLEAYTPLYCAGAMEVNDALSSVRDLKFLAEEKGQDFFKFQEEIWTRQGRKLEEEHLSRLKNGEEIKCSSLS